MQISHNKPSLGEAEMLSLRSVIDSSWVAKGKLTQLFENNMCEFLKIPVGLSVAVSNGTSALYLALKTLDVGKNDEVILPTYTCTALLNAIYMLDASPKIIDINERDFNLNYEATANSITKNTKAIIIPHTFGVPSKIETFKSLGIPIVEDCAQALGAQIGEHLTGVFGDISIFSFYASKMITTGQGGMVVTRNVSYADKIKDYVDFDFPETFYPRFNFQFTDIQAGIGIEQLKKLPRFLESRKQMADAYMDICIKKGFDFQKPDASGSLSNPNYYRFVIKVAPQDVKTLQTHLSNNSISTIVPIENVELLHNYLNLNKKNYPAAEKISKTTLSLPIYPDLVENGAFEYILDKLGRF